MTVANLTAPLYSYIPSIETEESSDNIECGEKQQLTFF